MPTALLYHAVDRPPADCPRERQGLCVDPEVFAWQLAELARRGYQTLTLEEFHLASLRRLSLPQRVLLTFDDAYENVLEAVTPILTAHGFSAVMFAPWAHLGSSNDWDEAGLPVRGMAIASAEQLRDAADGPWEIGSHGLHHVDLRCLDQQDRRRELSEARERLSELLGRPIVDLAYPYGHHDPAVRSDARAAGYRMAFAAGPVDAHDSFALPRRGVRGQEGSKAFLLKASHHFSQLLG